MAELFFKLTFLTQSNRFRGKYEIFLQIRTSGTSGIMHHRFYNQLIHRFFIA